MAVVAILYALMEGAEIDIETYDSLRIVCRYSSLGLMAIRFVQLLSATTTSHH